MTFRYLVHPVAWAIVLCVIGWAIIFASTFIHTAIPKVIAYAYSHAVGMSGRLPIALQPVEVMLKLKTGFRSFAIE